MPTWRCPHCGTPQAEASRCWVCKRSSTSCATCRHFRHSIAAHLGYCGLDPRRRPLRGDELRGCWEEVARATPAMSPESPARDARVDPSRRIEFVPVGPDAPPASDAAGIRDRPVRKTAASAPSGGSGMASVDRRTDLPGPVLGLFVDLD